MGVGESAQVHFSKYSLETHVTAHVCEQIDEFEAGGQWAQRSPPKQ